MKMFTTKKLVLSGLFIALGLILPIFTHAVGLGNNVLPMHIPVLICGFVCGWPYGLVVGLITPLLSSLMTGMPPLFPVALAMALELGAYGAMAGLLYKTFPKKNVFIYVSLVISMIFGRIIWGTAMLAFLGLSGKAFTWAAFTGGAFVSSLPGIIIQIILIPILIIALKKAKLIEY
ncbi:MAG: ECF transporter S component [Saccharofermentanales bacterium]